MSTPSTTFLSNSVGEDIFPVSLRGLRAEAELYPLLTTSHGTTRSSCYDDVVAAIYRGWMDDSVIMAGALFAYLWGDYLPREFTSSALRLLFSMESGGAEEEVFQERGSALRATLREYQEWSGEFLRWSREADGEAPTFPWERLSKEMVREGVVAPEVMRGVVFDYAMHSKALALSLLVMDPLEQQLWEKKILLCIIRDYRVALGEMATALVANPLGGGIPQPLQKLCQLSSEEKALLKPVLESLKEGLGARDAGESSAEVQLVLSHGGALTVENLLTFSALVREYNWEWAVASMEWIREVEDPEEW